MKYFFVISARFVPLKNYTLSSQHTIYCALFSVRLLIALNVLSSRCDPILDVNGPIIRMVYVRLIIRIDRAISNNGFRSDSLYEKKIGEDLVFNNALPKSLTINTSRVSKGKTKIA